MKPVQLSGKITRYKGNGRRLGYPTANLNVHTDLKDGIYFGYAYMGVWSNWPALIFIGTPETVGDKERRVEAYLLDIPDKDYYGEHLKLYVEHFHRSNRKLDSLDELMSLMQDDEAAARSWFSSGNDRP